MRINSNEGERMEFGVGLEKRLISMNENQAMRALAVFVFFKE